MNAKSQMVQPNKLKSYCAITSSKRIYAADYVDKGVPFVRGKEVVQRFSTSETLESKLFISRNKFESIRDRFGAPVEGDLLLTSVGTLGVPYLVKADDEFYFKDGNLIWFREFDGLDSKFLYYWLQSPHGLTQLSKCTIGTSQQAYTIERLKELELDEFSRDEQRRIASILSTYDDLIENNRRRIQLLEQAARLLYREWFVRFRFPGHEQVKIIDGVPEGWEKSTAFEVMEVLSGGTPKTSVSEYWNGDIPFFTPKDSTDSPYALKTEKCISEQGLSKCNSQLYPKDTIFITARGTVGNLNLAQGPMAMNQSCYALIGKEPVTQYLLYYALKFSIDQFKSRAVGSVFDAIIRDTFKAIPFVVPSIQLIASFTEWVTTIFRQIDNLLNSNVKLAQARDLLLPRLMNGEIKV